MRRWDTFDGVFLSHLGLWFSSSFAIIYDNLRAFVQVIGFHTLGRFDSGLLDGLNAQEVWCFGYCVYRLWLLKDIVRPVQVWALNLVIKNYR